MIYFRKPIAMPTPEEALPGRSAQMLVPEHHLVTGNRMAPPFPSHLEFAMFGMGCFWGAEKLFWETEGVFTTAVGYAAGHTPNPLYEEVCSGLTGHNEVVRVVFDPNVCSYETLTRLFWEYHDPTQGMRQGPDIGTQYRSGIYYYDEGQEQTARATKDRYESLLAGEGFGEITTEILPAPTFYYAEHYHQQYLIKVPHGYCEIGGTGVCLPTAQPPGLRRG